MNREQRIKELIVFGWAKNREEAEKTLKRAEEYESQNVEYEPTLLERMDVYERTEEE